MLARRLVAVWFVFIVGCLLVSGFRADAADKKFPHVVSDPPLTPREQLETFHLPPGFSIELVAAEPDVRKPMNLNFDASGRLWFTQSVEYPYPLRTGIKGRDTLRVVDGFNADGSAKKVSVFGDGLNIPIGQVPIHGGALVFSIPNIYRLTDADGDGVAEKSEVLFGEFGQRDTHGLNNAFTRSIDGWIYACHGYINSSPVAGTDGQKITIEGGNVYRFREDGSHIEYYTHGQVNPFGLAIDSLGNLFSADCHTQPAYMLLRGGYYPSFNKPHDGLGFAPQIMKHSHGSTGIAGIVCYEANEFPEEYRGNLFIGNPITHCINRDQLKPHGSSYEAVEQSEFLTCDDPWFRPVDLKLGPDGAIYVADFYNCIIGHYEVPLDHPKRDRERGRIWRIVYTGTDQKAKPTEVVDLTKQNAAQLIEQLAHPNITVRTLATNQLVDRFGKDCTAAVHAKLVDPKSTPTQRANGLWVLGRLKALDDSLAKSLLNDPDRMVRVQAIKCVAELGDWNSPSLPLSELIRKSLSDPDAFVRRAAADALGRHPQIENVRPMLELWTTTPEDDEQLVHTLRMALRDHLAVPTIMEVLSAKAGAVELTAGEHERIAELCLGIPSAGAANLALDYLRQNPKAVAQMGDAAYQLVRYVSDDRLNEVYELLRQRKGKKVEQEAIMLIGMQRAANDRGIKLPAEIMDWGTQLAKNQLSNKRGSVRERGIDVARELKITEMLPLLAEIAVTDVGSDIRLEALLASLNIDGAASVGFLNTVMNNTAEELPLRQRAARSLGVVNNEEARKDLIEYLPKAPERLAVEIANSLAASTEGAEALLATIGAGKASALLLQELPVVDRLKQRELRNLDERIAQLTAGMPSRDQRIRVLIEDRMTGLSQSKPDVARGKQVFAKTCAACHKIDGEGNKVGPELDGIGIRGAERVLEDVLDPSRNVDQAFRTTMLSVNGKPYTGLLKSENDKVLVLIDSLGKDTSINVAEIDEESRRISPLSPMPANVQDLVPAEDFYHLIEFLLAHQPKPTGEGKK